MSTYFIRFIAAGLLTVLLVTGCADGELVAPQPVDEMHDEAIVSRRVFVGRDSFGVALNAKISGTVTPGTAQDSEPICWTLAGNGQVTHLGTATVTGHTACVDEAANPTTVHGAFTYEGQTGGTIKGKYEGTLEDGILEADVTITEVEVQAVKEEPQATPPGGGTMTGTLTETSFRYTIEGWLFQRVR